MQEPTPAEDNPYRAPQSVVADVQQGRTALLYVVSPFKFWLLGIGTMGLYLLYWFYEHWASLNLRDKAYWPVPRAIFSVFFTHSLFDEIDGLLRRNRVSHAWSKWNWATMYVVATIASAVISRFGEPMGINPVTEQAWLFVLMVPMLWSTYEAQIAANLAMGDPKGSANSRLTVANVVWLLLGGLLWAATLFGMYVLTFGGGSIDDPLNG